MPRNALNGCEQRLTRCIVTLSSLRTCPYATSGPTASEWSLSICPSYFDIHADDLVRSSTSFSRSYSYCTTLRLPAFCSSIRLSSSLSKFAGLHPGGEGVLYDATVAGKDATAVFFGLHRAAVLEKYARLIIGQVGVPECFLVSVHS